MIVNDFNFSNILAAVCKGAFFVLAVGICALAGAGGFVLGFKLMMDFLS